MTSEVNMPIRTHMCLPTPDQFLPKAVDRLDHEFKFLSKQLCNENSQIAIYFDVPMPIKDFSKRGTLHNMGSSNANINNSSKAHRHMYKFSDLGFSDLDINELCDLEKKTPTNWRSSNKSSRSLWKRILPFD